MADTGGFIDNYEKNIGMGLNVKFIHFGVIDLKFVVLLQKS